MQTFEKDKAIISNRAEIKDKSLNAKKKKKMPTLYYRKSNTFPCLDCQTSGSEQNQCCRALTSYSAKTIQ